VEGGEEKGRMEGGSKWGMKEEGGKERVIQGAVRS
jgi:hypothetical protein